MTAERAIVRSDDWVERVRAASDIVDVVGQTVSLKRVGRNWMGLCKRFSSRLYICCRRPGFLWLPTC